MLEELLEKIQKLEKNMELLLELQMHQTSSLTTYKEVAKFIGVTRKTIYNYVKEGKLVLDTHYYKDENKKIVFIPQGIIDFKSNPFSDSKTTLKFEKIESKKEPVRINNPLVSSILRGVA